MSTTTATTTDATTTITTTNPLPFDQHIFHSAIHRNDLELLKQFMKYFPDCVNTKISRVSGLFSEVFTLMKLYISFKLHLQFKRSPLHIACLYDLTEVVKLFFASYHTNINALDRVSILLKSHSFLSSLTMI